MIGLYYEDHRVGATATIGAHEFTREAILAFARAYDPQPFHLDDAAGAASLFGSLCASGWHTASVCMRLLIDFRDAQRVAAAARGEPLPALGVGLGVRDLRWTSPVRPGDIVTYSTRIESMRETKRPQWGIIGFRASGVDQSGREVLSYFSHGLFARREG
ncbi:MAG TPA: MaoC/PaaZ C-terminal domain-containing protein [Roseiarcus sp.]|nr:MaoC/PaaZ C-terminal domain-containing protein [Roseiarcus sp.]